MYLDARYLEKRDAFAFSSAVVAAAAASTFFLETRTRTHEKTTINDRQRGPDHAPVLLTKRGHEQNAGELDIR